MVKKDILNVINQMPEHFTFDEMMYRLYIINNHEKASHDIKNGNVYSTKEVRAALLERSVINRWKQ